MSYIQLNPNHKDWESIKAVVIPIRSREQLIEQALNNIRELKKGVARLHYLNMMQIKDLKDTFGV